MTSVCGLDAPAGLHHTKITKVAKENGISHPEGTERPEVWTFWEDKMDALLTAEAYSGGAERRQIVAHGVSRGFPGAPRASPGGAIENLAQGALLQLCRP